MVFCNGEHEILEVTSQNRCKIFLNIVAVSIWNLNVSEWAAYSFINTNHERLLNSNIKTQNTCILLREN